jgi:prepilin-type N-terminal cleavage/methylation domain-containing protein
MSHFFYTAEKKKGFTLVEMIVVITIIGILASVLFASFSQSRKISRDKIRKADLKQLQLAIELYKSQNGRYPSAGCAATWAGPGPQASNPWITPCEDYIVGLVPDYMPALPKDPLSGREQADHLGYSYRTDATGSAFKVYLNYTVESLFITSYSDEFAQCPQGYSSYSYCPLGTTPQFTNVYSVYSAGAEWW